MKINKLIKYLENYKNHGYKDVIIVVNREYFEITGSYEENECLLSSNSCIVLNTSPSSFGFLIIEDEKNK